MDYHKNAPWTAMSRERLARMVIEDGVRLGSAAARFSVSGKTAAKWVGRYRQSGPSRPGRSQLASAPQPAADQFFISGKGTCTSSRTHARLPDRAAHRAESGFGQPHPAPGKAEPVARSEPAATRAALRASTARRPAAPGYQGHDALRRSLAAWRWTAARQTEASRLPGSACGCRRPLAHGLHTNAARSEG